MCSCGEVCVGAMGLVVQNVRWGRPCTCVVIERMHSISMDVGRALGADLGKNERRGIHQNVSDMDTHVKCVEEERSLSGWLKLSKKYCSCSE